MIWYNGLMSYFKILFPNILKKKSFYCSCFCAEGLLALHFETVVFCDLETKITVLTLE